MFFSRSKNSFYDKSIHDSMPDDVVEITASEHSNFLYGQSLGKILTSNEDGFPVLIDPPERQPLNYAQVEHNRLSYYSNPITGSDRLFSESYRMQLMGEEGWELVRDKAIARYQEIQAANPWPVE